MKIHLNRAGQSLGQFTSGEVRAGFKEGRFAASDLAWRDGMPMWKPLGEVIDEIAPDDAADGSEAGLALSAQAGESDFPWEKREQMGFFNALFETIRMVLLDPSKSFRAMPLTGGFGAPLFFFVLCSMIGVIVAGGYQVAFSALPSASAMSQADRMLAGALSSPAFIGVMLIVMMILFVVGAFISAGISHLALMLVGGAKKPYEATFRVLSYAGGACAILQFVPVCGGLLMWIWSIVVMVIGFSEVHGIGKGHALLAVLLPVILCCGLIFVSLSLALGGGISALLQSTGQ